MTPTGQYISRLQSLKDGDLGELRRHQGLELDQTIDGFDLFSGLWWPLRQDSPRAPRREVAWLIAKLYAFRPLIPSPGETLAFQLGKSYLKEGWRLQRRFDDILKLPVTELEPALRWALRYIASNSKNLDWVQFTDDLSIWRRESTRLAWVEQFWAGTRGRIQEC